MASVLALVRVRMPDHCGNMRPLIDASKSKDCPAALNSVADAGDTFGSFSKVLAPASAASDSVADADESVATASGFVTGDVFAAKPVGAVAVISICPLR